MIWCEAHGIARDGMSNVKWVRGASRDMVVGELARSRIFALLFFFYYVGGLDFYPSIPFRYREFRDRYSQAVYISNDGSY